MIELSLSLEFGRDGNAENYLGSGWSAGENGSRWMIGATSQLWLDPQDRDCDHVLELELHPHIKAPALTQQRLAAVVGATPVGQVTLRRPATLGFRLPRSLLATRERILVNLFHPDAARPCEVGESRDDRTLALSANAARLWRLPPQAVERSGTGVPGSTFGPTESDAVPVPSELVMQFESLGDNCEFGLVQRRCQRDPLGLLRFASIELRDLLRGLRTGFAGLGQLKHLRLIGDQANQEYIVRDDDYGITYHTFLWTDQVSADGLLAQQSKGLQWLVRKLMDDVRQAEKIFVLKSSDPLTEAEVWPVFLALREHADNTLLWVAPATDSHVPGSVERIADGLLKGSIERFAPLENAHDLLLDNWLAICRNAWRHIHAAAGPGVQVRAHDGNCTKDSVNIEAIGDFASGPIDGVEFHSLAAPNVALPESPRFIFGPFPEALSAAYYRHVGISSVGVFRVHNAELRGEFLLRRDRTYFRCPELNIHEAHIHAELERLCGNGHGLQERRLPGQYVILAGPGNRVYGHWLIEYLPKLGLLNAAGYDVHRLTYLIPSSAAAYVHAWLHLVGMQPEQIVVYDVDREVVVAEELLLPTIQHNGVRASPLLQDSAAFLLGLIGLRHKLEGSAFGERILLSRGRAAQGRVLANREAIEEIAARHRFQIVQPEKLPLIEQVRMLRGARALIGEYGSALHGSIFAPAGTVVCALRGTPDHPGFIQSGIGTVMPQPTGYVFGETSGGERHYEFQVNADVFEQCIGLVFDRPLL